MKKLISVVTPVHIVDESDLNYLQEMMKSFSKQLYKNKELVISDDLADVRVKELCEKLALHGVRVIYTVSTSQGISINLNNAIAKASGDFIKIIFQDDFFISRFGLVNIWLRLSVSARKWHLSGSTHFDQLKGNFSSIIRPKICDQLLDGKNYISSPSVVAFKKESKIYFDSNLNYLMDCEWYLRMSHNFGLPIFGKKVLIANRLHKGQATHWAKNKLEEESKLSKNLHDVMTMGLNNCKCKL